MKKVLLSAFAICGIISLNAQSWVADSVIIGAGYANRGFYSLENGNVGSVPFATRDWLIDVSESYSATIRINGGFNAALYKYTAGDTAAWATLDTAGLGSSTGWQRVRDNLETLAPSAFEAGNSGHPNYGWGQYNEISHNVTGDRLFVYKTVGNGTPNSSVWKKVWIKELGAMNSTYTVLIADLNGANEETISISKQGAGNKNFIYYSFADDEVFNDEPADSTYDLIFTKHEDEYTQGGPISIQAVTGVESNLGVLVAKADNIVADDASYQDFTLAEDIYGIGADWKKVNTQTFQFDIEDSLSYFVQDIPGNIWQIRFTGFVGSSAGKYRFEKRKVAFASVEEIETIGAWNVFPNPTSDYVQVVFSAKTATDGQFSLIDLNGRTVITETVNVSTGINQFGVTLSDKNLAPGIYIASLRAGNEIKTTKLIVR